MKINYNVVSLLLKRCKYICSLEPKTLASTIAKDELMIKTVKCL